VVTGGLVVHGLVEGDPAAGELGCEEGVVGDAQAAIPTARIANDTDSKALLMTPSLMVWWAPPPSRSRRRADGGA